MFNLSPKCCINSKTSSLLAIQYLCISHVASPKVLLRFFQVQSMLIFDLPLMTINAAPAS